MTRIERERESFARIPAASTRRLFLKAGSAAAVFGSLSVAAEGATQSLDPVLVAIAEYDRAKAVNDAAGDLVERITQQNREIVFYHPKVTAYTINLPVKGDVDVYARSPEQIDLMAPVLSPDRVQALKAELAADKQRKEEGRERIGFTAAERAYDEASDRLFATQEAVLNATPTTNAGAIALATFAADIEKIGLSDDLETTFRTLAAFLSNRAEG